MHAGVIDDAPKITTILYSALESLLSFFGIIGIIGTVIAGILYLVSSGDEHLAEMAKRAITYSVIGTVVAFGSLIVVQTLSAFFK